MTDNHFIAVAGNIGAGKSTLTRMLAEYTGWTPFFEANAENPYLEDFYRDMRQWSFHSQVFFLGKRLEHHRQLLDHPGSVVQDRTVYEDAEVFARNLYDEGKMSTRDYDAYRRLYQSIAAFLPPPDVIIYLRADIDVLSDHIAQRGRSFEQDIDPNYLLRLNHLYEQWIENWQSSPVLVVDINQRDFQQHDDDLPWLAEKLKQMLAAQKSQT